MKVVPAAASGTEGHLPALPEAWWVRGSVGFAQDLDLTVQRGPDGNRTQWSGTLAAPRLTGSFAGGSLADTLTDRPAGDASLAAK
jgi:hypothetical protein